jgi:hypothetical protein
VLKIYTIYITINIHGSLPTILVEIFYSHPNSFFIFIRNLFYCKQAYFIHFMCIFQRINININPYKAIHIYNIIICLPIIKVSKSKFIKFLILKINLIISRPKIYIYFELPVLFPCNKYISH